MKSFVVAMVILTATAVTMVRADGPTTQPGKLLALDLGNGVSMKLVEIPAGKYQMGSPAKESRDGVDARHEVTIGEPFYMGISHVTVDQFGAFVKDSRYKTDAEKDGSSNGVEIKDGTLKGSVIDGCSWSKPSIEQKGDHPVVQVSWNDAHAFCDWLAKKSGKGVTLPKEEQWEYACRAGTTTTYPWGDSPEDGKGWTNCADQSLKNKLPNGPGGATYFSWDDGFVSTAPVASFKANAFGLYDMNGNAWQWCQDDWRNPQDPTAVEAVTRHVLRGGSWFSGPGFCRSAFRFGLDADFRNAYIGFRVVVSQGEKK